MRLNHGLLIVGVPSQRVTRWYINGIPPKKNSRKRGLLIQGWHYPLEFTHVFLAMSSPRILGFSRNIAPGNPRENQWKPRFSWKNVSMLYWMACKFAMLARYWPLMTHNLHNCMQLQCSFLFFVCFLPLAPLIGRSTTNNSCGVKIWNPSPRPSRTWKSRKSWHPR